MLRFTNPGVLDPRCVTTFGVNVKENTNPIGHFGTGLKYAIAVILRLGGTIYINTRDEVGQVTEYNFTITEETIRDKTFHFVHMETHIAHADLGGTWSTPLGFTTELGKNWLPWMAYRELRSNTMDENGHIASSTDDDEMLRLPYTVIMVNCDEVELAHSKATEFFLETKPLWANADLEIHPARTDSAVFYRGIRVAKVSQKSSEFSYNLLSEMALTEDRTIDLWSCSYRIVRALAALDNQELAEKIILARSGTFESTFDFDYVAEFSGTMRAAIRLEQYNEHINASAKRRSRALYFDDFLPVALPMRAEDHQRVAQIKALFFAFGFPWPWEAVRLANMPDDGDQIIINDTAVFVTENLFRSSEFILYLLGRRFIGVAWTEHREERQLLGFLRQLQPELVATVAPEPPQTGDNLDDEEEEPVNADSRAPF
jgi:hypothetical protein